ncbi:hypothetical protein [Piscinibacter defluvii]|uniref:hypothetical protein n=1 Tax=Piscinibacter defluvii TaxID=1796922 RepID=UPI000FDDA277|nr:hypothetical protein [Piscinibacter defluvii]
MRRFRFLCLVAIGLAVQPCIAAPVPANLLAAYGGEYSAKCSDPSALRARVSKEGLTLVRGSKSITGVFEMEALSYMGNSPPAGYETTLMSNAKGVGSIVFIMYRSKNGPMVDLDTDPPVLKRVGIAQRGTVKYKKC